MTKKTWKNTTKKLVKMLSLMLVGTLLFGTVGMNASAAEQQNSRLDEVMELEAHAIPVAKGNEEENPDLRTMLVNCIITMGRTSAGMSVSFLTESVQTASRIGVKDIVIQKKVWYGWKTVATSSGGEVQNASIFGCSVLYTGVEEGETYRISCVHYAYADEYNEVVNQGDAFVYYL